MKIYTRQGDQGKTRLLGGCLVDKYDLRIEAYGSIDEFNSMMGLVLTDLKIHAELSALQQQLSAIQSELFILGSIFACEQQSRLASLPALPEGRVSDLEAEIDRMTAQLTELKQFIIPGGHPCAAQLHVLRTLCRRCERHAVRLFHDHDWPEIASAVMYLNRLSDYLFTAARYANHCLQVSDQLWSPQNLPLIKT